MNQVTWCSRNFQGEQSRFPPSGLSSVVSSKKIIVLSLALSQPIRYDTRWLSQMDRSIEVIKLSFNIQWPLRRILFCRAGILSDHAGRQRLANSQSFFSAIGYKKLETQI